MTITLFRIKASLWTIGIDAVFTTNQMWLLSLSDCILEIEDSNTLSNELQNPHEEDANFSPSGTLTKGCKIERDDRIIPENGAGISTPLPTQYMMEIDDCLPEYCVDCPLWKPFSPRHFCWLKFRCRVRVLVEKKYFEWFILATVFFSSFTLVCWVLLHFLCLFNCFCSSYRVYLHGRYKVVNIKGTSTLTTN